MELSEAIIHARQIAEQGGCPAGSGDCAYQLDHLADWLEELRAFRNTKMTPSDIIAMQIADQEKVSNPPLTLEELKKLDGKPVWVKDINSPLHSAWWIIAWVDNDCVLASAKRHGGQYTVRTYGEDWLAYLQEANDDFELYHTDEEILGWAAKEKERLGDCWDGFCLTWEYSAMSPFQLVIRSENIGIGDQNNLGYGPISPSNGKPYRFGRGLVLCDVPYTDENKVERFEKLRKAGLILCARLKKRLPGLKRDFSRPQC